MGTNRAHAGRFCDENGFDAQLARHPENGGDGKMHLRDGRRRALGDIKNTYDPTNQANIPGKENGPAKKSSAVLEQASRAAQLARDGRILTRRTAKEAGVVIDLQGLQSRAAPKPKQVPRPKVLLQQANPDKVGAATSPVRSLSSLLQERSQSVLCNEQNKYVDPGLVEEDSDIDAADKDNPLAVLEYCCDIFDYYRRTEAKTRAAANYMTSQSDINDRMRAILVDWLVEVHLKFKLMPETLHLAVDLIDRFLERKPVTRKNLQLVGVTAMLIASKYEEIWAPELRDFIYISDKAYTREQILQMEKVMLNTLGFNLTVPTAFNFLGRFLKAADMKGNREIHFAAYLIELSLPEYSMVRYSYSMIAAASVYLTGRLLEGWERDPFPVNLRRHSGLTEKAVKPCAAALLNLVEKAPHNNLQAVHKKYGHSKFLEVAKLPIPQLDL